MLSFAVLTLNEHKGLYVIADVYQNKSISKAFADAYSRLRYYRRARIESIMEIYQYDNKYNIIKSTTFNPNWSIEHCFRQLIPDEMLKDRNISTLFDLYKLTQQE